MKLLALCTLSSFALAAPQNEVQEIEEALAEIRAELDTVEQSASDSEEAKLERLGLKIAEEALVAVGELLPAALATVESVVPTGAHSEARILIGITGGRPSAALAAHLHVDPERSIIVNSIVDDYSADEAGLRQHDLITAIDGQEGASMSDLREVLATKKVGDTLKLSIISRGQPSQLLVPIVETPYPANLWGNALENSIGTLSSEYVNRLHDASLKQLAAMQFESESVAEEIERSYNDLATAEAELAAAAAAYEAAQRSLEASSATKSQEEALLEATHQYEALRAEESARLARLQALEAQRVALGQQEAALRAQEETRIVDDGRWATLLMRDPRLTSGSEEPVQSRIGRVEKRVDELHSRFDRLEEMLKRLAPRDNN